jgi:hypothetical protein
MDELKISLVDKKVEEDIIMQLRKATLTLHAAKYWNLLTLGYMTKVKVKYVPTKILIKF